jgi:DNA-binding NtrC family response regulator
MVHKTHILLIEDSENEIEFFRDALEESGLEFLCSTAGNIEQAFRIVKNSTPDIIFVDIHLAMRNSFFSQKIRSFHSSPVVYFSTEKNWELQKNEYGIFNYVQLPGNIQTMARILKNLFAISETYYESEGLIES